MRFLLAAIITTTSLLVVCVHSNPIYNTILDPPRPMRRSLDDNTVENGSPKKICVNNTPCGWEVYIPFTRQFDFFMDNTCSCAKGTECVSTTDNLSVNAYVYRCRPVSPSSKTGKGD